MTQWAYAPHFLTQWAPSSPSTVHRLSNLSSSLTCTVGPYTSSFYDTVGIYPLVYLHNGYHPRHLLYTDCPASFPSLFAQWAHTSSFITWWAYTPWFSYTLGTTLASYCSQTVQPHFLTYLYSGPIPPHFKTQWAYTPSFTDTVSTTLAIYCTWTVQPHLLPYLHSGPIPPHFMTQWAYTPLLLTKWAPPSPSTVHRLSNLSSSLTCTVGPYLLILWHSGPIPLCYLQSGHHPRHLLYTDCRTSITPLLVQGPIPPHFMTQWAYTHLFTYTMGTTLAIYCTQTVQPHFLPYLYSGPIPPAFMTQWACTPSFTCKVDTTFTNYYSQTVQPQFLPYLHSGPITPHFMTQWAYTHSFTYTMGTTLAIYCTECPASVPPLLVQWAHTSCFYHTVGMYPLI